MFEWMKRKECPIKKMELEVIRFNDEQMTEAMEKFPVGSMHKYLSIELLVVGHVGLILGLHSKYGSSKTIYPEIYFEYVDKNGELRKLSRSIDSLLESENLYEQAHKRSSNNT